MDKRITIEVGLKMCDLIARALNGSDDKYSGEDINLLFDLCCHHRVSALVSTVIDPMCYGYDRWENAFSLSVLRKTYMDLEREKLIVFFRENNIWYLLMKGLVLERLYPDPHLREMCDNDILYDSTGYKFVKRFMLGNGYTGEHITKDVHVDEYEKKPYFYFELHKNFFNITRGKLAEYYCDVNKFLIPIDKCEMKLSDEDFYVYMIAHCYKHFIDGGTGIRSFIDCYLYNNKVSYNKDYVKRELNTLGIADFEKQFSTLADKLFSGRALELSEAEKNVFLYVVSSGAYGTKKNLVRNQLKDIDKSRYLLERLFPPLEWYKGHVPYCYNHKWTIPFYCVYRIFTRLLKHHKRIKKEIDIVKHIDK